MAAFDIIRGTSKELNISVTDDDGNAVDLTNATCELLVAPDLDADSATLTKSLTIVGDPTNGNLTCDFVPGDTSGLSAGMYEAEVKATYNDGTIYKSEAPFQFTIIDPVKSP